MVTTPDGSDRSVELGTPIRRRTLLSAAIAVGILGPLVGVGTGTAHADDSDWYPIPEESGSIPWW